MPETVHALEIFSEIYKLVRSQLPPPKPNAAPRGFGDLPPPIFGQLGRTIDDGRARLSEVRVFLNRREAEKYSR